jgi:hypothetical protein
MDWKDIGIGAAIVFVVIVVFSLVVGIFNLPVPQWLISGLGGAIGVAAWFWIKSRSKAS